MKKYIIILLLFVSAFGYSQVGGFSMLNLDPKTTAERDNVSIAQGLVNGSIVLNENTGTLDWYNGSTWVSLGGSGSTYTAGDGIDITGSVISVDNPFTDEDETKLDGIATGATDYDGSDAVKLTGTQTITGSKTFNAATYFPLSMYAKGSLYISHNGQTGYSSSDASLRLSSVAASGGNYYADIFGGNQGITNTAFRITAVPTSYSYFNNTLGISMGKNTPPSTILDVNGTITATSFIGDGSQLTGISGGTDDQTAAEVTYDNTTSGLTATDVQGAIDELESLTGGSASLTGYHSMLELTANGTASYANQVTGSGYRVINEVKGTTDIDYIINNLRSSLVNENYSFVSNSSSSILELLEGSASFVGKGQEGNNAVRVADYGSANLLEISDGVFRVDGDFEWFSYAQNLILNGLQGAGSGNGATGGTHPGMTRSGTLPTYIISDDGSSAFDFNRYEVKIVLADNGLSVGDTIQIEADAITGGTNPNIYVNINSNSNTQIATINASQLSDTGVIPSGATELSIWFLPNFNSTNNTTATFTNVRVTKL